MALVLLKSLSACSDLAHKVIFVACIHDSCLESYKTVEATQVELESWLDAFLLQLLKKYKQ